MRQMKTLVATIIVTVFLGATMSGCSTTGGRKKTCEIIMTEPVAMTNEQQAKWDACLVAVNNNEYGYKERFPRVSAQSQRQKTVANSGGSFDIGGLVGKAVAVGATIAPLTTGAVALGVAAAKGESIKERIQKNEEAQASCQEAFSTAEAAMAHCFHFSQQGEMQMFQMQMQP